MPEENNPEVPQGIKLDLSEFDLGIDEGSGELQFNRREAKPKEEEKPIDQTTEQAPVPDDKFATFDNRLNSIIEQQSKQSNALSQMINYLLNQPATTQEKTIEKDQLEQVFGDADKGSQFLNSLTSTIEKLIDSKLGGIQPLVQKLTLQEEIQSVQTLPDYEEYLPAMHHIININPSVTIPQAYQYAKERGWKTPVQNKQTPSNVQNINDRKLPERTASSNATLGNKQINSLRDAMEQALDELTGS